MKIGVLYSRVRVEEKWIFEALEKRGVNFDRLDDREVVFDIANPGHWLEYAAVLERSMSFARPSYRHLGHSSIRPIAPGHAVSTEMSHRSAPQLRQS